ncbi:MAG: CoA-binding protein [Polyangia bacterium]
MSTPNAHLVTEDAAIVALAGALRRVAVLGIRTEAQSDQPGYYVPKYLVEAGVEIVPVPVYYPEATEILGQPVVRDLTQAGPVDAVIVFRRGADVPMHLDALLALAPKCVWMQQGIAHAESARRLAEAGIDVVQDRCVMVDHRRAHAG